MRSAPVSVGPALVLASAVAAAPPHAFAEPGLLLVAHGSHSAQWNEPLLAFGRRVAEEVAKAGRFKAVRTGLLEGAQPDVPTAVAELEAEGCARIVAVPLFIAPSGHTHFDVPAVLGIYSSPRTSAALAEEGARAARPRVPIVLTQTLAESDLLAEFALAQVRKLSQSPADEAVVVLAHGDPEHHPLCERLLRRVTTHCCGRAGISYGDWAYIGVGQEYLRQGVPAVQAALEHKKRALVVGLYVGTSPARIHQRAVQTRGHAESDADPFAGKAVALSDQTLVSHPAFLQSVVEAAHAALAPHPESAVAAPAARP